MKWKAFLIAVCHVFLFLDSRSQLPEQPLQLYDTIPDIELEMVNYKSPSVRLSDFRGKLLILDFWSTWCYTCIEQFPKLAKIQARFKDEVMILPIGFQSSKADDIREFYAGRRKKGMPLAMPSAIQDKRYDTLLRKLLPSRGVPMLVWINHRGQLVAVTTHLVLTEDQVAVYIDEQKRIEDIISREKH